MSKQINVFGEPEDDPICSFMDCYHPFSYTGKGRMRKSSIVFVNTQQTKH